MGFKVLRGDLGFGDLGKHWIIPARPTLSLESELFSFRWKLSFSEMIKFVALLGGEVDSLAAAASKTPIDPLLEVDGDIIGQLLVEVISPKVLRKFSLSSSKDRLLLLLINAKGLPGARRGDLGAEDSLNGDLGAEESAKDIGCD